MGKVILRLRFTQRNGPEQAVIVDADPHSTIAALVRTLTLGEGERLFRADGTALAVEETLTSAGILDGDEFFLAPPPRPRSDAPKLYVVEGPDKGREFVLSLVENTIGRAQSNQVVLHDGEISRRHAVVRLGTTVTIEDVGSSNGTTVAGVDVTEARILQAGELIGIGETVLEFRSGARLEVDGPSESAAPQVSLRPDGHGGLLLNRIPSLRRPHSSASVQFPLPLRAAERRPIPWIPALIPLVFAGGIYLVTGTTSFLLFALLSPLTLGANMYTNRRADKRRDAGEKAEFNAKHAAAVAATRAAVEEERRWLVESAANGAEAARIVGDRSHRLWERSPGDADFLDVTVGIGTRPAAVPVSVPPQDSAAPDLGMVDAPLTIRLRESGVVGIAGSDPARIALARSMVTQLATLHAADDVRISLLAEHPVEADWEFLRWLPHTWHAIERRNDITYTPADLNRVVSRLLGVIAERAGSDRSSKASTPEPVWIAVLDGASTLRRRPDVAQLLSTGPEHGVYAIALDTDARLIPEERRTLVEVDDAGGVRVEGFADRHVWSGRADQLDRDSARTAAVGLAPIRRVGARQASGGLPTRLSLFEMLGSRPTTASVSAQWDRARSKRPSIPVGSSAAGVFSLDLVRSGPHALVGGTSGSGKSEFVQTWVVSAALHTPPDELTFLFVEYKGLSAFRHLQFLPHCVGTITNLSGELTARALTSLTAELRRRQTAFSEEKVGDISEYATLRLTRPDLAVLPRLVIVLDEFAEMKQQIPEFIEGLLSIARTGRSLGVHLILATQQVGRAVSGEISGNANLRVSLRATTPEDSYALIEANDAAQLPQDVPGRAIAKRGELPIEPFQAAWSGGPVHTSETRGTTSELWPWNPQDARLQTIFPNAQSARSELVEAVELAKQVVIDQDIATPRRPFSDPMPTLISLDEIRAEAPVQALVDLVTAGGPYIGRRDDPAAQIQEPYALPLLRGHVAVIGSAQAGRTSLLRTAAASWAAAVPPTMMHLHAIDGARGLLSLGALPHAGTVTTVGDGRAIRLLMRLATEVDRRLELLASSGMGEVLEWWTVPDPAEALPWMVLLIDRFEELLGSVERGPGEPALERILSHGTAAGVTILAAGDETLVRARWQSRYPVRLVLRNSGGMDSIQAGLPPRLALESLAPGRGYESSQGNLIQVAVIGADATTARQNEVLRGLAAELARRWAASRSAPMRLRDLPQVLDAAELPAAATPDGVVLGVGGDSADAFELTAERFPLLVAGADRTGRTATLRRVATAWVDAGRRPVILAPAASPLVRRPVVGTDVYDFESGQRVVWGDLLADPGAAVVVDDMHSDDLPDELVAVMAAHPRCLFAGAMRALTLVPEPLLSLARRGTLLFLCSDEPRRLAAYEVRVDASLCSVEPVGRGILAHHRMATVIQIAAESGI